MKPARLALVASVGLLPSLYAREGGTSVVGATSGAAPPATASESATSDTPSVPPETPSPYPRWRRGPVIVGGGIHYWGPPFYVTVGPNGPVIVTPPTAPTIVVSPGTPGFDVPRAGPVPSPSNPAAVVPAPARRRVDVAKRDQLLTVGDRLFRAGNWKRAEERYQQAARLDPDAAAARVRLAQVALVRADYAEAARRFREAIDAEPGWLPRANGIAAIYGEPGAFEDVIARLESHVVREPRDRDAWLALGAQYYLAGRTRQAADVFLRLTDRKPDAALAAFLDATRVDR